MPYYSFNIKKGKYLVEMSSDDVYFANRQVDKLFKELIQMQGKLRVVLPSINSDKVEKETKKIEQEKKVIPKELTPEVLVKQDKQPIEPEKKEVIETAAAVKELPKVTEKVIDEPELPQQEEVIEVVKVAEPIAEKPSKVKEEPVVIEEVVAPVQEIIKEEPETEEEIEVVSEQAEEAAEEQQEESLFRNILAEKTLEIEEEFEKAEEQELPKEEPKAKKAFSFKSIVAKKPKDSSSDEVEVRQKAGFKNVKIEEPEVERIKPQDVVSPEDEEIAKILEEKIKKSLPPSMSKALSNDKEEQEITANKRQGSFEDLMQSALVTEEINEEIEEIEVQVEEPDEVEISDQEITSLEELIELKNPQSKLDYLLLTAFYLQTNEDLFKYSLKQINSKVVPFLGSLIDHSVIHNAVAHDFIEVVPDYSGTAEVTEYRLTQVGEDYLVNGL